jgi:hypothetical protein
MKERIETRTPEKQNKTKQQQQQQVEFGVLCLVTSGPAVKC